MGLGVGAMVATGVGVGVGVGSGSSPGAKEAANTPRPMLAVSTAAEPPATTLYSGSRANALPEKYFIGFRF
ncbi:MAG: hypothetical protein DBX91_07725 [Subdoligranulum variabile]|nr:MAG: hypothetical protein DBX91_07725 [Subdoligranulum variabile]